MSFEQKYLKYKSKYLALKIQAKNLQKGGSKNNSKSFYGQNILDLDNLSVTPSMMEVYGYDLIGGINYKKNSDISKLSKLLTESDFSQSAGSDESEFDLNALTDTPSSDTGAPEKNPGTESAESVESVESGTESAESGSESGTESAESAESAKSVESVESVESDLNALTDTPSSDTGAPEQNPESETEQQGGKEKTKSNKKYFFEDSDFELNSTTTDSELSSLESDTSEPSDADL